MKLWEIRKTQGAEYSDNKGQTWICNDNNLINSLNQKITDVYSLAELLELQFTGHMDWTQVAPDTPIFVKSIRRDGWEKKYFAYYNVEKNRVLAYEGGRTSWTSQGEVTGWPYFKLA